ncbi:hypothetical protein AD935_01605 [Gluconobacter japonicus]|nr:hypothetical protein AD935_01605 [Gluconobacter japonicus]
MSRFEASAPDGHQRRLVLAKVGLWGLYGHVGGVVQQQVQLMSALPKRLATVLMRHGLPVLRTALAIVTRRCVIATITNLCALPRCFIRFVTTFRAGLWHDAANPA